MKIFSLACLLLCPIILASACHQNSANNASHNHQAQQSGSSPTPMTRRIPAYFKEPPDVNSLPPTLQPEKFQGKTRDAYQVAKEIPQTLAQLPCFCYCDTIGHKSLHSCYEDEHSTGCTVCQDSALIASQLKKEGLSDSEIREKLIAKYGGF
jgi:hypothetical protein